jgi:hypothetical protein
MNRTVIHDTAPFKFNVVNELKRNELKSFVIKHLLINITVAMPPNTNASLSILPLVFWYNWFRPIDNYNSHHKIEIKLLSPEHYPQTAAELKTYLNNNGPDVVFVDQIWPGELVGYLYDFTRYAKPLIQ